MAYQPFLSKNIIINRDDRGPIPALEIPGDCDIIRILPTIDSIIYITEMWRLRVNLWIKTVLK